MIAPERCALCPWLPLDVLERNVADASLAVLAAEDAESAALLRPTEIDAPSRQAWFEEARAARIAVVVSHRAWRAAVAALRAAKAAEAQP